MKEWVPIRGYEGYYDISINVEIKSLRRKVKKPHGYRTVHERLLKTYLHRTGYRQVLLRKEGKTHRFSLHRLMALNFIPNPLSLPEVNHKDGDKSNNTLENLEWCTSKENIAHSWQRGLINIEAVKERGRSAAKALRKPVAQLSLSGELIKVHESMLSAHKATHIPLPNIVDVCKNRRKTAGGFRWASANPKSPECAIFKV